MNHITDHFDRAYQRLAEEFRVIPEVVSLIRAKARQTQDLEDAIWSMFSVLGVDNAPLPLLKLYSKIVGLDPGARDEASLRRNIKAIAKLNRSSGTIPDLLAILRGLIPQTATLSIVEGRAQFMVTIDSFGMDDSTFLDLSTIIHRGKMGGVRAFLEWSTGSDAESFVTDDGTGTVVGLGLGDDADPTAGGVLAGAAII